jgi:hypothetical protein
LSDRVIGIVRDIGSIVVDITTTEVDILGRVRNLLSCAIVLDESSNVLLDIAVLERQTYLLTGSVITDADGGGDVSKAPETTLCEVQAFFLEVLELVAGGLPFAVPAGGCFFEDLYSLLVFAAGCRHLDLRLLQLGLVFALLLAHNHVALSEVTLDLQTVLFVAVASLVDSVCLLRLCLEQLLNAVLNDLATLLEPARKGRERFFELALHLLCDVLMGLAHSLQFSTENVQGHAQSASLRGAQGLPREVEDLARILFFDGGSLGVEGLEFVAGDFGIVHAFEQWVDAGVFLAPEVVCDWTRRQSRAVPVYAYVYLQESDTLGAISDAGVDGMAARV